MAEPTTPELTISIKQYFALVEQLASAESVTRLAGSALATRLTKDMMKFWHADALMRELVKVPKDEVGKPAKRKKPKKKEK